MLGKQGFAILRRLVLTLLLGGFLTACTNPWAGAAATFQQVLNSGWLLDEEDVGVAEALSAASPVYCYGTIGKGDCHSAPLSDSGNRLVGYQGPPPYVAGQE